MDLGEYLYPLKIPNEVKDTVKSALPRLGPEDYAILRVLGEWDLARIGRRNLSLTVDPIFLLGLKTDGDYEWWRLENLRSLGLAADLGARSPINQVRITMAGTVAYNYLLAEGVFER